MIETAVSLGKRVAARLATSHNVGRYGCYVLRIAEQHILDAGPYPGPCADFPPAGQVIMSAHYPQVRGPRERIGRLSSRVSGRENAQVEHWAQWYPAAGWRA